MGTNTIEWRSWRPASGSVTTHKVVAGDTVWALAVRYHTTITAIVKANNLKSANLIIVGQTLKIPVA